MKIECVKESLQKIVSKADKITGRNLNLPILSTILLSVKNKQLCIKATNLDLGVEFFIPVKVFEDGEIAVPGALLNNYLSNLYSKNITLESKNGVLTIASLNGKTTIKSLPTSDFPIIPKIPKSVLFSINSDNFISGLKSVWYAASPSSIKPELSSVYIYPSQGRLLFVATDSFRLAEKQISSKVKDDFPPLLIPFKNIPEIIRCLEDSTTVDIAITKNQISFSDENFYLTSRVIDGIFPDYRQIIPKNPSTEAILLKEDIVNTLHLANIFTDKFSQISFSVRPKNKTFEIKSQNTDTGASVERVESALSGEDLEISFNYRYIADAFQSIHSDSVSFSFSGTQKALIIKGISDPSFMYLAMPMNR